MEKNTEEFMGFLGDLLDNEINHKQIKEYGWMLLVFPFEGEDRTANYISNASREDMIKALREKADVLEKKIDITGDSNAGTQ